MTGLRLSLPKTDQQEERPQKYTNFAQDYLLGAKSHCLILQLCKRLPQEIARSLSTFGLASNDIRSKRAAAQSFLIPAIDFSFSQTNLIAFKKTICWTRAYYQRYSARLVVFALVPSVIVVHSAICWRARKNEEIFV